MTARSTDSYRLFAKPSKQSIKDVWCCLNKIIAKVSVFGYFLYSDKTLKDKLSEKTDKTDKTKNQG